jgi:hypothetical protein
MNLIRISLLALCLLLLAAPTWAADLTKIDRTLRKEPAYRSKSPKYCLLVFGPKAETRVWLVLDLVSEPWETDGSKNALYIDRNGNGDLTEPGERVACTMQKREHWFSFSRKPSYTYDPCFEAGAVVERDGKTRHTGLTVEVGSYVQLYRPVSLSLTVEGRGKQSAGGPQLRFADRPEDAPVIHFNGPLMMRVSMEGGALSVPISYDDNPAKRRRFYEQNPPHWGQKKLTRGRDSELYAQVGTPGVGLGTFVTLSAGAPPADVHPVAEITFPSADPKRPPITRRVVLKGRC